MIIQPDGRKGRRRRSNHRPGREPARPDGRQDGASRPRQFPAESGGFPSLLSEDGPAPRGAGEQDDDRSFARDLNLDQIVAVIAGDREGRDLITRVLYTHLRDAGAVRYRQEVFRDLEDPALFDEVQRFADRMGEVRAHLRRLTDAVPLPAGGLVAGRGGHLLRRGTVAGRAPRLGADQLPRPAGLPGLPGFVCGLGRVHCPGQRNTRDRKEDLRRVRYCTRIKGGGSRSAVTRMRPTTAPRCCKTFERFKQGAVKDYRIPVPDVAGMNHVAAEILELVARLFPEEFTALDEYCGRHGEFLDEGIRRADPSSSSIWPTWTTSGRFGPPGCASAIPRSPPPRRRSSPPTPSTWPWRTSSSRSASRWSPTTSAWRAVSASSS